VHMHPYRGGEGRRTKGVAREGQRRKEEESLSSHLTSSRKREGGGRKKKPKAKIIGGKRKRGKGLTDFIKFRLPSPARREE